ncbi:TPA: hypothetical protein ACYLN4_000532 [Burkholderia lata]
MLELTNEQVAALADIDAKGFVSRIAEDLVRADPDLAGDPGLTPRVWRAFRAARQLGIREDDNLIEFLRLESYAPGFYDQPALRTWLTRPGRAIDERFRDYLSVVRWKIQHPEFAGGLTYGEPTLAGNRGSSGGAWTSLAASWRRFVGRNGSSGNS